MPSVAFLTDRPVVRLTGTATGLATLAFAVTLFILRRTLLFFCDFFCEFFCVFLRTTLGRFFVDLFFFNCLRFFPALRRLRRLANFFADFLFTRLVLRLRPLDWPAFLVDSFLAGMTKVFGSFMAKEPAFTALPMNKLTSAREVARTRFVFTRYLKMDFAVEPFLSESAATASWIIAVLTDPRFIATIVKTVLTVRYRRAGWRTNVRTASCVHFN